MIHRIRMARKWLMVARERRVKAIAAADMAAAEHAEFWDQVALLTKEDRRYMALRAIERRKDRTC